MPLDHNGCFAPRLLSRIFRRLPFLLPLCIFTSVAFCIYTVSLFSTFLPHDNLNAYASLIRDREEIRLAKSLTKLNEWKHRGDFLPFHYKRTYDSDHLHSGLIPPPGITFAMLVPNRRRYQVDIYEPSYCIESLTRLLTAVENDILKYGKRFSFINITLCPTEDRLDHFSELIEVTSLLTKGSVKPRLRLMDSLPITCRTVLDAASCLLQSAISLSDTSYVILFEDDMMIEERALNQLWKIFQQFEFQRNISHQASISSGRFMQLHTDHRHLKFSIFDFQSLLELFVSAATLTFLSFGLCLRCWYRPYFFWYNCLLIFCTLSVCTFVASLFGRSWWLYLWHKAFAFQFVFVSLDPWSHSTGSSPLISSRLARGLGHFLHSLSCTEINQHESPIKSQLFHRYLLMHHVQTLGTFPSLFKHSGLYSLYLHNPVNPGAVEWY